MVQGTDLPSLVPICSNAKGNSEPTNSSPFGLALVEASILSDILLRPKQSVGLKSKRSQGNNDGLAF